MTGVFQFGAGIRKLLNDLIGIMRRMLGSEFPVEVTFEPARNGEVHAIWSKIEKARGVGLDPQTSLEDGVAKTWQWFKVQMLGNCPAAFAS